MLYAHLRLQLRDLKRKKPIREDGLFNFSDVQQISNSLQ